MTRRRETYHEWIQREMRQNAEYAKGLTAHEAREWVRLERALNHRGLTVGAVRNLPDENLLDFRGIGPKRLALLKGYHARWPR